MENEEGKGENPKVAPKQPVFDAHEIEELRKRLYARGSDTGFVRHATPVHTPSVTLPAVKEEERFDTIEEMPRTSHRNTLRKNIMLGSLVFFIGATLISSVFMFFGGNTISGQNISIGTDGGIAVGGGEAYEFQVTVANQNNVPIQSAVLYVEYPRGTRSATDASKEISIESHQLESIGSGQVVNIPLSARMFGEENEEKRINVWIEYRVAGSNATFEKRAEPVVLKVTSSPVVVMINTVEKASSGEEIEIDLVIQSNSPTPLTDLLIKTTYPQGFDFGDSDPDTVSGEDTWRIATLAPNEKKTITVTGLMTGGGSDTVTFGASIGVATGASNSFTTPLATTVLDLEVEQPLLQLDMELNGRDDETVVVAGGEEVKVEIEYTNTLSSTIYNGEVSLTIDGEGYSVDTDGAYDEATGVVRWNPSTESTLSEMTPGKVARFDLTIRPKGGVTSNIGLSAAFSAEKTYGESSSRVGGETERTIKFESVPTLQSQTNYGEGPFVNTGLLPPVVGKVTQYTYLLTAKAGSNDLAEAEVTATIPPYVDWLDLVTAGDEVRYNAQTRTLTWVIGNLAAHAEAYVGMQVSFLPESSHVGQMPTILNTQRFKAVDRYTGTTVRAEAPAITTDLGDSGISRVKRD